MPGGRQTQGQGMMMAAARSPSPNKSQARRRMPLNRSSELQASGGSMENSGARYFPSVLPSVITMQRPYIFKLNQLSANRP
ncbi:hypothetical protein DPMN_095509 [Dreissena polymorpha]|uniref:Uncharacterized protein n=1 Tax=Dreissena polymorpha TaxID=45954 RepID=A0A9D4L9H1_DREPO|nr:hypothetical protein DPMN_095509 [Dreissena polymorpha]